MGILGLIALVALLLWALPSVLAIAWTVGIWLIGGAIACIAVSTVLVLIWAAIVGVDEVQP